MTVAMVGLHRVLPPEHQEPLPPEQITENAAAKAGVDLRSDEETQKAATLAAHFGYGATVGALYAPFAGSTGLPRPVEGMLYGLAVWGGSYFGVIPGAGLYKSAEDEAPERNAVMIAAHLIWGASLGVLVDVLSRDRERR
jgi:putative membrane protein